MYRRIIDRYVQAIVDRLPFWVKKRAEKDLKKIMYSMLQDYCEGERPTGRDVRAIIQELGRPSEVADQYYYQQRRPRERTSRAVWRKRLQKLQMAVTVLAVCLIFAGVVQMFVGMAPNLLLFMIGTILAVFVVIVQFIAPDAAINIKIKK
ncbi:MAG: CerR family C-terminal domain-containing protein [Lachnospiraceae bacterium]|nr:CerR family C-terminal domain-containing protein [Lachnospiraceae bacterium]